jgi:hypothetical protein
LKHRVIAFTKVAFGDIQKAKMVHNFSDFVQVAILDSQDAEIELAWPCDTFKHRLIKYDKFAF